MNDIKYVLGIVFNLLNTRLYFSPYSFTILQVLIGFCILSIIIFVIRHLFIDY